MSGYWKYFLFSLVLVGLVVVGAVLKDYLSLEYVQEHRQALVIYISEHYMLAVILFLVLYVMTALFLPGALALTVAGGMMFGKVMTVLYVNLAATSGATVAFFAARYLFGERLQQRFATQLKLFNAEMQKHGRNYLLVLRLLPVIPFFVVNYCAGITRIPVKTFIWTTSLGVLPGSFIYAFAGEQLLKVNAAADLFSWKTTLALALLALFALMPVILHHLPTNKG